ncbi:ferredoxin [Phenylobacterium sp.]|uniref:ferredoxin n=1 Tax=Phenylobacterium sp. TaxID=1871053 RepID=UPI0035675F02
MDSFDHPSGLRVRIDRARCVCSETCASLAPQTFETDEQGLVRLLDGGSDPEAAIRTAVAACPVQAISIETPGVPS